MIESFRSKALKRFWTKGDEAGLKPEWRAKVRIVLSAIEAATEPSALNVPGFGFHALTGDKPGRFALIASRNWRITSGWTGENAVDIDMEDYHRR